MIFPCGWDPESACVLLKPILGAGIRWIYELMEQKNLPLLLFKDQKAKIKGKSCKYGSQC